jgi:amidohydrolase
MGRYVRRAEPFAVGPRAICRADRDGIRGLSEIAGLLLGSVTHKVPQLAHIPVLVVRAPRTYTREGHVVAATADTNVAVRRNKARIELQPAACARIGKVLTELHAEIEARQQDLLARRRRFHAEPELAFQEVKTAGIIAEHLERWGLEVTTGLAKTGVVGTLRGGRPGRGVLVRADMDALPLTESSQLPFQSTNQGVMHACGHDVHMAIALTLAELLASRQEQMPGLIRFAFQPAEEVAGGAKPMVEAGILEGVDRVVGLHVWAGLPVGKVSVRAGPIMASADWFSVTIQGKGGHGAQPHLTADPIIIASHVIVALQTLVSREISPISPAVVTIGSIHGGNAHNIIPDDVVLRGTLRTFDADLRQHLLARIAELSAGIARAMHGDALFEHEAGAPPVVNHTEIAAMVADAAREVVGCEGVIPFEPLMVGEDVSYFLEQRPGCFFLLGGAPDGDPVVHHTAAFRIDERCLPIGLEVLANAVVKMLQH